MASDNLDKRVNKLEQAAHPKDDVKIAVDWGDTISFEGKTYSKEEWEKIKAELGFDETGLIVGWEDIGEDEPGGAE